MGIDKSKNQLSEARKKLEEVIEREGEERGLGERVTFREGWDTNTTAEDGEVMVVTVGQASHWFDLDLFGKEMRRIIRKDVEREGGEGEEKGKGGVVVLAGYGICSVTKPERIQPVFDTFYKKMLYYWSPNCNRKLLDKGMVGAQLGGGWKQEGEVEWFHEPRNVKKDDFLGYINSWSSVAAWEERKGEGEEDPREVLKEALEGVEDMTISFPFFLSTFVLEE